jgi:DNA-binding IclR family transcriptional regulator
VERALALLSSFDEDHVDLGVAELARRLGLHRSTVSRIAATLERAGFLRRERERYRLGNELMRLGSLALSTLDLVTTLRPAMERLASLSGETVNLAVPDGRSVLHVAELPSAFILSSSTGWTGRTTPPHAAANGKVLMAYGAIELPEDVELERFTRHTVTSRRKLDRELAIARQQGYATAVSELEDGLVAVAAPVFDGSGRCVAALSVSGPELRLGASDLARLGRLCAAVSPKAAV